MKKFVTNCTRDKDNGMFKNFNILEGLVSLYGVRKEDIIQVELTLHENQERPGSDDNKIPEADYWGWLNSRDDRFSLVYAKYLLLNMCFPYGIEAAEENNEGKAYRLNVREI